MSSADEEKIKQLIPAEFHMISGSHDVQTSADVYNVNQFELPNPSGKAGGACTSALLQVLYGDQKSTTGSGVINMSWVQVLRAMRDELRRMGYDQVPQLTSSRMIDVNKQMHIVPPSFNNSTGRKRAILVGINYTGQQGELRGCHNDANNIKKYLINVHGFKESDMLILMDNGQYHSPTRRNITDAFERITQYSNAGDIVFVHYSGHGGRVRDTSGDEEDGYDETLIPVDFKSSGQILDDELLKLLVKPMRAGVTCTVLMDCCHSGTVLDLPYRFSADDSEMRYDSKTAGNILGALDVETLVCCALLGYCLAEALL